MSKPPRFRVPVHVFVFGLGLAPGIAYAFYYGRNKETDSPEFEAMLRERYADNVKFAEGRRQAMQEQFNSMGQVGGQSSEQFDGKVQQILRGGRGELHRPHVDRSLYGTEEGIKKKEQWEQELVSAARAKDRSKDDTVVQATKAGTTNAEKEKKEEEEDTTKSSPSSSAANDDVVLVQSAIAVALIGASAAILGFALGSTGSRR